MLAPLWGRHGFKVLAPEKEKENKSSDRHNSDQCISVRKAHAMPQPPM